MTTTIKASVKGYMMEIDVDAWKACKGARERGTGLQLEPDEPAGFEVTAARLVSPEDIFEIVTEEVSITLGDINEAVEKYEHDSY